MDEQRHFDTWTLTIRNCFSIFSTVCLWALAVRHTRKFCQFVIRQLIFVFCFFFVVSISLFSFLPQWQRKPKCSVNIRIATKIIACHNYLIIYYWFCLCRIKKKRRQKKAMRKFETVWDGACCSCSRVLLCLCHTLGEICKWDGFTGAYTIHKCRMYAEKSSRPSAHHVCVS